MCSGTTLIARDSRTTRTRMVRTGGLIAVTSTTASTARDEHPDVVLRHNSRTTATTATTGTSIPACGTSGATSHA